MESRDVEEQPPSRRPSMGETAVARVCVRVPGRARVCVGVRLGVVKPPAVRPPPLGLSPGPRARALKLINYHSYLVITHLPLKISNESFWRSFDVASMWMRSIHCFVLWYIYS